VALTFPQDAELVARSKLAWLRGEDRELHGGEGEQPLLELRARARRQATLILLDWDLAAGGLPGFFRQLPDAMPVLDWTSPATLAQLTAYAPVSLRQEDWDLAVHVNLETLPFLHGGAGRDVAVSRDRTGAHQHPGADRRARRPHRSRAQRPPRVDAARDRGSRSSSTGRPSRSRCRTISGSPW
jgi:hypothetical protein